MLNPLTPKYYSYIAELVTNAMVEYSNSPREDISGCLPGSFLWARGYIKECRALLASMAYDCFTKRYIMAEWMHTEPKHRHCIWEDYAVIRRHESGMRTHPDDGRQNGCALRDIDGDIYAVVGSCLADVTKVTAPQDIIISALNLCVREHSTIDLGLLDYGCTWDNKPRLSTWLTDVGGALYASASERDYVNAVGEYFLLSAVKRLYWPGCRVGVIPVLLGAAGFGKTSILEILGGNFFASIHPRDIDSVDIEPHLRGVRVAAFDGVDQYSPSELQRVSSFVSRHDDICGRPGSRIPRHTVFACTADTAVSPFSRITNPRLLPVTIGSGAQLDELMDIRPKLFAEAVVRLGVACNGGEDAPIMDLRSLPTEHHAAATAARGPGAANISDLEQPVYQFIQTHLVTPESSGRMPRFGLVDIMEAVIGQAGRVTDRSLQNRVKGVLLSQGVTRVAKSQGKTLWGLPAEDSNRGSNGTKP